MRWGVGGLKTVVRLYRCGRDRQCVTKREMGAGSATRLEGPYQKYRIVKEGFCAQLEGLIDTEVFMYLTRSESR